MTETATEKPQAVPGMYPTMGWGEYAKVPALSKSSMEFGMATMKHMRAYFDGRIIKKDTTALVFGRALHCRLLEPARFKEEFVPFPAFEQDSPGKYKNYKATTEYAKKEAEWEAENEGKIALSQKDWDTIERMAEEVYAHPAAKLMHAAGGCEHSMVWKHSTGLSIKGRMDKFCPNFKGVPVIIDVKTTKSCDPDSLARDIKQYGYHRQDAIYTDGATELTGERPDMLFLFVESTEPHDVVVHRIDHDSVALGRQQYQSILQRWAICRETGIYPGRSNKIESIGIPAWELKRWRMDQPS